MSDVLVLRRFTPDPPLILQRIGPDGRLAALAQRAPAAPLPYVLGVGPPGPAGSAGVAGGGIFINVKDSPYNAQGDGSTDDYAAIQAALDHAQALGGATVYFPAGSYRVSATPGLVNAKGINLRGEGPDVSIIKAGAFPAFKTTGYWRSIVEGMGFWCDGNTTGGAFQLDGHADGSFGVQGLTFRNCYFFGGYTSRYAFTNQLIAGGAGQGSEIVWIGCGFAGTMRATGTALLLINGYNALQNTLIGCNLQSFVTGVWISAGNIDILHCGFQSTYGYDQLAYDGADLDASGGSVGDTVTMTGCRSESLRILKGGGPPTAISNFAHVPADGNGWGASLTLVLNNLCSGQTAAGNRKLYRVTTAGTTGGTEPVWPESGTVSDGTIVWTQLEYDVFYGLKGRLVQGQLSLGGISCSHDPGPVLEDLFLLRNDAISGWRTGDGAAPTMRNVLFFNTLTGDYEPLLLQPSTYPGTRQTNPFQQQIGHSAIVSTVSKSGGICTEISIERGGQDGWPAANWWQLKGGFKPGAITYAEITDAIGGGATFVDGVVYFVTDGIPGSSPLTGGGTGCLAVRQNGVWRAVAMGSSGAPTRFDQSSAGTWIITHGFGRVPTAQVFLDSGESVIADITSDTVHITVTFASPTAGFVLAS